MQSVSSRVWNHVVVSISNDDNHYTMGTTKYTAYALERLSTVVRRRSWLLLTVDESTAAVGKQGVTNEWRSTTKKGREQIQTILLVLCEMQPISYRIWTRISVSIYYDDNQYITGTSKWFNRIFPQSDFHWLPLEIHWILELD